MRESRLWLLVLPSLLLCVVAAARADVPQLLNHQGVLTDGNGVVVPDDEYVLEFRLYDVASLGTQLFAQTLTVNVVGGLYNVLLSDNAGGSLAPAFAAPSVYLEVEIVSNLGGTYSNVTLSPRQQIASVPFALNAGDAARVDPGGWIPAVLENGWVPFGPGWPAPQYRKDGAGMVHLMGLMKGGSIGSGTRVFSLPSGYRPLEAHMFAPASAEGTTNPRLDVRNTGDVLIILATSASMSFLSLDGISFLADGN